MYVRACMACAAVVLLGLVGCSSGDDPGGTVTGRVTVFAAASLKESFTDLAHAFEQTHPGSKVQLSFAGSQQLAVQITQGAPANVFASADLNTMQNVVASGRITKGNVTPLAKNLLVVVAWYSSKVGSLEDLARPHTRVILAASKVPVGAYSVQALDKASQALNRPDFAKSVLANVLSYEQDVRAVLTKVQLGEADAGIVYLTDAAGATRVRTIPIPDAMNVNAEYWIAPLDQWNDASKAFVAFALSPNGAQIMKTHGFIPLSPK